MTIRNDPFLSKIKNILTVDKYKNEIKFYGSYIRHGKEKSADLDMAETIIVKSNEKLQNILTNYFNKLKNNKYLDKVKIRFNIIDKDIECILKTFGYLDVNLNIKDDNIDLNNIPINLENKANNLLNKYNNNKILSNYIELFSYLYSNAIPEWSLDEAIDGKKLLNNKVIELKNIVHKIIYIETIIDNIRVSNYIIVKNVNNVKKVYKLDPNILYINLQKSIKCNTISYYDIIKKFQNQLFKIYEFKKKYSKFNNIIEEFRKKNGKLNFIIGQLENKIELVDDVNTLKKLNYKYNKILIQFNNIYKKFYFDFIVKKFNKIVTIFFKYKY
jgi:hypothetical protein